MSEQSLLGLEEKVAVVTGGGGNIGRATSVMLARAGARVVAVDRDGASARTTAEACERLGAEAFSMEADTTQADEIDSVLARTLGRWGRIDVDVNIVGGGGGGTGKNILELSDETWQLAIEHNLFSAVRCSRIFGQAMVDREIAGSIVNIASPAALRAAQTMASYGAAKAALINFTWTLAVELAPYGIRANVVVPAFVTQPSIDFGGSPAEQDALAARVVPMGHVTRAEDVAGAIVCFASDLTSYSTGQVLVCDGGRLLTNPIFAPKS